MTTTTIEQQAAAYQRQQQYRHNYWQRPENKQRFNEYVNRPDVKARRAITAKNYYATHKNEINAKRRLKYNAEKNAFF